MTTDETNQSNETNEVNQTSETIAMDGSTVNEQGIEIPTQLIYTKKDYSQLNGFGVRISGKMARKLIKNYWDDNEVSENTTCAFTFGKESLLSILTQKNCEGIRFYLAKRKSGENSIVGTTLVAIGVKPEKDVDGNDGNDPEIGAKDEYIIKDLVEYSDSDTDMMHRQTGIIIETIPPLSLGEANAGLSPNTMNEIMEIYIGYPRKSN